MGGFSFVLRKIAQLGEYQSGQLGQTVNLLSYDFIGSNPISPTASAEARAKAGGIEAPMIINKSIDVIREYLFVVKVLGW